ncbi:unnamed protein product [Miscanthus lutarioriparius]|uniref:Uncharacterized protein n=1 Tax=Miscanthus lutarioriparius TaxID=422564 RepID=A0A811NTT1_9POAL|nr:unnamed protein product [Miscanthus lutarioriparius]
MRIMIKGGVWKNTEDEILKAAVMKYGKNQWARISSLLVRKSAKQCKARWYEWLDPSIKKTEWTREEDEKLLHLAKLMPTQWRTIAPIVGRTPSQCLERYEKLLDAACAKDENYEANDDPRKLRPGEIDPNPESKPARPDPVDMDEDEKEMLSEARARLANTRGFYDTVGEDRPLEHVQFPTTIEELEGKRRADIEAQLRKQDIARNKILQRQDAPAAIMQANKLNDPEAVTKRSKLMLPPPQISDHELEEIAKMGNAGDPALADELGEGSTATKTLLASYSQTPRLGMTPLRTPQRTPAGKGDAIMMEAENLARLRESQTPLLGGDNPELHPSDFSGVTPRKKEIQTPNPMATPLASPGPGITPRIGMTPSREGHSFGLTPRGTPFRDELRINEEVEMQDSTKLELRRQAELRKSLRSSFASIPQPKNEYQIVMPPITEDEKEEAEEKIEEDMSDRLARERTEEQARLEALLRKRSKVLQRSLPRPPAASVEIRRQSLIRSGENRSRSTFVPPTSLEQADELINEELFRLLEHDNAKYPLDEKTQKEKKKGSKRQQNGGPLVPEIDDFDEDELKEASSMVEEEIQYLRVAMGHENESFEDFVKAHDACQEDLMFFPTNNSYGLASVAGNADKISALQNEFETVKKRMDDEAKKASRLEQKIKLLTQGYQVRAGKMWSQVQDTFRQMDTVATELECFQELQKQEHLAASYRILNLTEEVNKQKALERTLQSRYGQLVSGFQRIQEQLEEHKKRLKVQEVIEAENRAHEEEVAAPNHAAEEEDERKPLSSEEKSQQTSRATDEEAAGSKGTTKDQMDVDSGNGDGVVGPIPPTPNTEGDNDEVSIQDNTSNTRSSDCTSTKDGADKINQVKLGGQDKEDDNMAVDAGPREEGKDELAPVGASISEENTTVSSDQDVSKDGEGMAPE